MPSRCPSSSSGIAFVVWARPIARTYHGAFGAMGRVGRPFQKGYAEPGGPVFVRVVGVLFVAIAAYWAVVGTG
jgi:hypothetical protein